MPKKNPPIYRITCKNESLKLGENNTLNLLMLKNLPLLQKKFDIVEVQLTDYEKQPHQNNYLIGFSIETHYSEALKNYLYDNIHQKNTIDIKTLQDIFLDNETFTLEHRELKPLTDKNLLEKRNGLIAVNYALEQSDEKLITNDKRKVIGIKQAPHGQPLFIQYDNKQYQEMDKSHIAMAFYAQKSNTDSFIQLLKSELTAFISNNIVPDRTPDFVFSYDVSQKFLEQLKNNPQLSGFKQFDSLEEAQMAYHKNEEHANNRLYPNISLRKESYRKSDKKQIEKLVNIVTKLSALTPFTRAAELIKEIEQEIKNYEKGMPLENFYTLEIKSTSFLNQIKKQIDNEKIALNQFNALLNKYSTVNTRGHLNARFSVATHKFLEKIETLAFSPADLHALYEIISTLSKELLHDLQQRLHENEVEQPYEHYKLYLLEESNALRHTMERNELSSCQEVVALFSQLDKRIEAFEQSHKKIQHLKEKLEQEKEELETIATDLMNIPTIQSKKQSLSEKIIYWIEKIQAFEPAQHESLSQATDALISEIEENIPTLHVEFSSLQRNNQIALHTQRDALIQNIQALQEKIATLSLPDSCQFTEEKNSLVQSIQAFWESCPPTSDNPISKIHVENIEKTLFSLNGKRQQLENFLDIKKVVSQFFSEKNNLALSHIKQYGKKLDNFSDPHAKTKAKIHLSIAKLFEDIQADLQDEFNPITQTQAIEARSATIQKYIDTLNQNINDSRLAYYRGPTFFRSFLKLIGRGRVTSTELINQVAPDFDHLQEGIHAILSRPS